MAGTGKTSLMQRLNANLHAAKRVPYVINLDPAVLKLPYGPNIDIRDTVNYKEARAQPRVRQRTECPTTTGAGDETSHSARRR